MQYLVTTDRKVIFMDMEELPKELQPVDEETILQERANHWANQVGEKEIALTKAKLELEEARSKHAFYVKQIKSYNKAFKK